MRRVSSPLSRSLSRCNRDRFFPHFPSSLRRFVAPSLFLYFPNEPIRKSYFNPAFPARPLRVCQTRPGR